MAGIGFRLQKLLSSKSYTGLVRAYAYSALIATGPMIVVIFVLGSILLVARNTMGFLDAERFMGIVTYAYAFSMVSLGPVLYVIMRYLADKYYLKRMEAFSSSYVSIIVFVFALQAVTAHLYLLKTPLPYSIKLLAVTLYLVVSGIWIAMIYLSAAKNYQWIGLGFALGGLVSLVAAYLLGLTHGFQGFLEGYVLGQATTFVILTVRIFREFGYSSSHDFGFFAYFIKHPYLMLVGTFYYAAIWVDKFIFWLSPISKKLIEGIVVAPDYDTPMFLAYMTVIPSMAYFVIQIETSFVLHYQAYYKAIQERQSLKVLEEKRQAITQDMTGSLQKFVLFQGAFTALVILFVYEISEAFALSPLQMGIFRIGVLGCFLQMGFLIIVNYLFYFDFQKEIFVCVLLYFISNALFSYISVGMGLKAYGFGMALSNILTLFVSFMILNTKLKNLHYWTFMSQPVSLPRVKFETEQGS